MDIKYSESGEINSKNRELIENYKKLYKHNIPFPFNKKKMLKIILTPSLIAEEAQLLNELNRLTNLLFEYQAKTEILDLERLFDLKEKRTIKQIIDLVSLFNVKLSVGSLANIVNRGTLPEDNDEKFAYEIYRIIRKLEINEISLEEIYQILTSNPNFNNFETTIDLEVKENIIAKGYDVANLNLIFNNLEQFIATKNYPPFIIASIAYFVIRYGYFFDKYNHLMAIFLFFKILSDNGYSNLMIFINFFDIFSFHKDKLDDAFSKVIKEEGDITYLYFFWIKKLLSQTKKELLNLEKIRIIEKKEKKFLSKREIKIKVQKIIKHEPLISKRQAHFYVEHSNWNEKYSINDFLKYNKCSYETGRYSMDNLVNHGFYKKEKIGKAFFYAPLDNIEK